MIRKFVFWIVGIPVAGAVIALSVANRHVVTFSLDPAAKGEPFLAFEVPLYLLMMACIFVGLFLGWGVTWAGQHKWRAKAAVKGREAKVLKREVDEQKRREDPLSAPALPRY